MWIEEDKNPVNLWITMLRLYDYCFLKKGKLSTEIVKTCAQISSHCENTLVTLSMQRIKMKDCEYSCVYN